MVLVHFHQYNVVDMIVALLLNRSGLTWVILSCWDFVTTRYSTLNTFVKNYLCDKLQVNVSSL